MKIWRRNLNQLASKQDKIRLNLWTWQTYTEDEIWKAKQSPSFPREYHLQYLGLIRNIFHTNDIERAIMLGKKYNPNKVIIDSQEVLSVDPRWRTSASGLFVADC